jgi:TolA-binding protein
MTDMSITRLENQLEGHIRTTNSKLDILIDLTRQMAAIQERQKSHTDEIARLDKNLMDERHRTGMLYDKLEVKMASMELDRKTSIDRLFTKMDEMSRHQSIECSDHHKEHDTEIERLSNKVGEISDDYYGNKNFNKGVMWILGIVVALSQVVGYSLIDSMNERAKEIRNQISALQIVDNENKQAITTIQTQIRDHGLGGVMNGQKP